VVLKDMDTGEQQSLSQADVMTRIAAAGSKAP
jgi:hypothetical protein